MILCLVSDMFSHMHTHTHTHTLTDIALKNLRFTEPIRVSLTVGLLSGLWSWLNSEEQQTLGEHSSHGAHPNTAPPKENEPPTTSTTTQKKSLPSTWRLSLHSLTSLHPPDACPCIVWHLCPPDACLCTVWHLSIHLMPVCTVWHLSIHLMPVFAQSDISVHLTPVLVQSDISLSAWCLSWSSHVFPSVRQLTMHGLTFVYQPDICPYIV